MTTDNNANLNASRNKINPVDLNSFKVGTNKNDLKTEQNLSIFESLDVNSDGVLNDEEVLGIVTGKTKDKDGNYKEHEFIKVKDLSDGRSLVIDSQGKQQVLSHDGIVLKESYLTKPHSQFKDLKVDSHGNIDENQFTFAALKEKYQSEDYEVWTKTMYGANYIFIDDKKTGKNIKRYEEYNNGFDIWEFDKNEKPKSWMKISKGKITSNTDFGPDDTSKKTAYNNDGTINNVETDKTHITYINNMPFLEDDKVTGKRINHIAEDIKKDIYAKNRIGLPTTGKTLKSNVLERINPTTIESVLEDYRDVSGNNLIDDINNEIGLDSKLKAQLIAHIEDTAFEAGGDVRNNIIAKRLIDDMKGIGTNDRIYEDIKLLTPDNVRNIMIHLGGFNMEDNLSDPLISGIAGEVGLSLPHRRNLINHVLSVLEQSEHGERFKDVAADIRNHIDSPLKLRIDSKRLYKRLRTGGSDEKDVANGKFDKSFSQGNVGDCWLISGLVAIIEKPKGKEALESLLTTSANGDILVNLKGVGKSYVITKEENDNNSHLSEGDADARAIEIAVDRYFKESNYKNLFTSEDLDLNGNTHDKIFEILFGNSELDEASKFDIKEFNDDNKCFVVSFGQNENQNKVFSSSIDNVAKNTEGESVSIERGHGFSILGSDDKYVYLIDPNHRDETILMPIEDFKKESDYIGASKFQK